MIIQTLFLLKSFLARRLDGLIVLEGLNGSGKSSQGRRLLAALQKQGFSVLLRCEHTRDLPFGKLITRHHAKPYRWLSPTLLQLCYTLDRGTHLLWVIIPALAQGKTVICDRYFFSTFAHGASVGVPVWLTKLMNLPYPSPGLTLLLDLSPQSAQTRISDGRRPGADLFEKIELQAQETARAVYLREVPRHSHAIINAELSQEEVAAEVIGIVSRYLNGSA